MFDSSYTNYLQKIATELKGECCASGEIQIKVNFKKFQIYIYPSFGGGKISVPAYFQIKTTMTQPSWPFEVRKNDVLDWIAEHVFFKHDFQVGDNKFDCEYFISVENQSWAKKFFSKQIVRTSIADILSNGFHKLSLKDRELKAIIYFRTTEDFPSADLINIALQKMQQICSNAPTKYGSRANQAEAAA